MNEALVDLKGIALVSKMTGQDVNPKTLKPLMIFLAALVTILVGVIAIDGVIAEEEEQHLQTLLNALIPPGNPVYPQVQQMIQRVETQQIYLDPHHLQTLIVPLSESERLLLLGLGYEIAAADGEVDVREKLYLQAIAQRLTLAPQYQNVLEAAFVGDRAADAIALNQVKLLLNPDLFSSLDIVCVNLAQNVLSMLS
jgi:uncharacterized tellurite resistance protein B-like protein